MAMAMNETSTDRNGAAEVVCMASVMQERAIYDVLEQPSHTTNNPNPRTVKPRLSASKIILTVLAISMIVVLAVLVWHIAGVPGGNGPEITAHPDVIGYMTGSNQDQSNKLEDVVDKLGNLTAAGEDMRNKLQQLNDIIDNLTVACRAQKITFDDRIRSLTAEVAKQAESLDLINENLGYTDCQEYRDHGYSMSRVYNIHLYQNSSVSRYPVYCDMATNGGGWTVLLRRMDGSVDFNQTWDAYKNGFGDLPGEFWAGNELMYRLSSRPGKTYRLRVELGSYDNQSAYAEYDVFRVDSEHDFYRLHVSGYNGTAGDTLTYQDDAMFSTWDADHDFDVDRNCAVEFHGGFWYQACHQASLTGLYGSGLGHALGITWYDWLGHGVQLKTAVMMVRPV